MGQLAQNVVLGLTLTAVGFAFWFGILAGGWALFRSRRRPSRGLPVWIPIVAAVLTIIAVGQQRNPDGSPALGPYAVATDAGFLLLLCSIVWAVVVSARRKARPDAAYPPHPGYPPPGYLPGPGVTPHGSHPQPSGPVPPGARPWPHPGHAAHTTTRPTGPGPHGGPDRSAAPRPADPDRPADADPPDSGAPQRGPAPEDPRT